MISLPTATQLHALLIGIDYYQPNRLYKSLRGAVRDIDLVDTFLQRTLKAPPSQIRKLTSPNPDDLELVKLRSPGEQSPTYANIVQAFADITTSAHAGEQVYIHYSGHGGRANTVYPNLKQGIGQQDEGLVPMDIGDTPDGRYIRDVEMTTLLKRMTDKGLIVTIVLDSCHSGGATRGLLDYAIRSGSEPDSVPRTGESLVASRAELEQNWREKAQNQVIGVAGLPKTRDYVLLAACRSNEYAYEYAVNGSTERHGALTYWMIDTLNSLALSGQPISYKRLHDRVNARIQSQFPQQIPMLIGECDRIVFGADTWKSPFTVHVIRVISPSQVTLNAGQAQGMSRGTQLAIYPLHTTDFQDLQQRIALVEITKVAASESDAKVLPVSAGGMDITHPLEPGAPAIVTAAPAELIQRVRFVDDKIAGEDDNQLPIAWVVEQVNALDKIRQALVGNGWVQDVKANESAGYQVAIDREGHYEICRGTPIPNLRPLLAISDPTAPQQVVDRLVHLAKYQAVQSLDNSSSKLAKVLQVEVLNDQQQPVSDLQDLTVQSGEILTLRLSNRGSQPLKIAVLDLEPTWEISQIEIGGMQSSFFNLDVGAIEDIHLQFQVPDDEAYQQSQEILKIFAVQKGLADFRWLTLPPLDTPKSARGAALQQEMQRSLETVVTRGEEPEGENPLNALMAMIGADIDSPPTVMRSATPVIDPKQEWMTQQVHITVKRG